MDDKKSESPAQRLHRENLEPLAPRVQPEWDAARQLGHDESVNGRNVGSRPVATPIITERIFQLPPDNGGTPPPQPEK